MTTKMLGTPRCAVCPAPGVHVVAFTVDGEFAATFPLCALHVRSVEHHEWVLRLYGDGPTMHVDARDVRSP